MRITETKKGLILEVLVKPSSKEFKVDVKGDEIIIYCREEPVRGKVNKELIKEVSKLFRKKVELVSGFTSKQKRLLVSGVSRNEAERVLLGKQ
jgi:hypothetical protein